MQNKKTFRETVFNIFISPVKVKEDTSLVRIGT